jgi:hypothetical protein
MFIEDYSFWIMYDPNTMIVWGSGPTRFSAAKSGLTYASGWMRQFSTEPEEYDRVNNLRTIPASLEIKNQLDYDTGGEIATRWEVVDGVAELKPASQWKE